MLWSLQASSKCTASTAQWEPRHLSHNLYKNQKRFRSLIYLLTSSAGVKESPDQCHWKSHTPTWREASPSFFFLYWPLQQQKVRLMGHHGPQCPDDEVWVTQRLPEAVVLTALVISLWVSLYLMFLLKALLYLHYNMRVSAVIKEQRGWCCLDNNNPTDSTIKKGGLEALLVLAQWISWFWGGSKTMRHYLVLPDEGSPWTPHGEGDLMLLGDSEEEGPWTNHRGWECQPELPDENTLRKAHRQDFWI